MGRAAASAAGIAGVLMSTAACNMANLGNASAPATPYTSNGLCTQYLNPTMPTSTGTQTPSGFPVQMRGVVLAPASSSATLASAYTQFNNMTCTKYSHAYSYRPPRFYYYDCVGFTGYAVRQADPTAWNSVMNAVHLRTYWNVPTPLAFETFFNSLKTTPQPNWRAVATVRNIRAGDVLAWQPANANGTPNTSGVGHSVMPLVAPRAILGSNGTRWEVVVMDSTAGGHGPQDTRKPNNPLSQRNDPIKTTSGQVQASGLGIGTIALDTNASGQVTGVEWNVGNKPEPIVFGAGRALAGGTAPARS